MFSLHTALHRTLIDIRYVWARPGTICEFFAFYGNASVSRLNVDVYLILHQSGRLMEIDFLAGCTFVTGVPGKKTFLVAPASTMASCLVICIIDVDYALSVCLFAWLLMIIVLSLSSSVVSSGANTLVILCVVGYNKLILVSSRFCLSILTDIGPAAPYHHPLHCCCCFCCFEVSFWHITHFGCLRFCARIHPLSTP